MSGLDVVRAVMTVRLTKLITPADAALFCALSDAKTELGLADGSQNAFLTRQIAVASALITQYVGRPLLSQTVQDTFMHGRDVSGCAPGDLSEWLSLSRFPVTALASVTENGSPLASDVDVTLDAAAGRLIRLNDRGLPIPWSSLPVVVTYTGGYDPASIPFDLQDAAIRLVVARFFSRGRDPLLRQENVPGVREATYWVNSTADGSGLPPEVEALLVPYRVPVTA